MTSSSDPTEVWSPSAPASIVVNLETLESYASSLMPVSPSVYYVDGLLQVVCVFVGFLGSLVTVPVYRRPNVWSSFNYYLIALSLVDTVLLVAYLFANAFWVLSFGGHVKTYGWHVSIVRAAFVLCHISVSASVWFTIMVTIERYLAICHPFRHHRLSRGRRRIVTTIAGTGFLAIVYNLMKLYEFDVYELTLEQVFFPVLDVFQDAFGPNKTFLVENRSLAVLAPSELYDSPSFLVYRVVCRVVFDTVIPVCIIAALTGRMFCVLFQAHSNRVVFQHVKPRSRTNSNSRSLSSRKLISPSKIPNNPRGPSNLSIICQRYLNHVHKKQAQQNTKQNGRRGIRTAHEPRICSPSLRSSRRLNLPLLLLLVKFLVSHTLPAAVTVLEIVDRSHMLNEQTNKVLNEHMPILLTISNFLIVFNSSSNCFVFLFCGQRFRAELRLFCCEICHKILSTLRLRKTKHEHSTVRIIPNVARRTFPKIKWSDIFKCSICRESLNCP